MDEKDIIDADKKRHWFLEEVIEENKKKVKKPDNKIIEVPRKKSKPNKRKGCGCK